MDKIKEKWAFEDKRTNKKNKINFQNTTQQASHLGLS